MTETTYPTMTGSSLRELRQSYGMSQARFGAAVGIHWNTIARMERDKLPITTRTMMLITLAQTRGDLKSGPVTPEPCPHPDCQPYRQQSPETLDNSAA